MIKIVCSRAEKKEIDKLLDDSNICIFPEKVGTEFCLSRKQSCHDCYESEIEWEISDEKEKDDLNEHQ